MRINNISSGTNFGYRVTDNAQKQILNLNKNNEKEAYSLIHELEKTGNDNTIVNSYINNEGYLSFNVIPKNCDYRILDSNQIYNQKTKQFNKENFVSEVQAMEKDSIIGRLINSIYNGQLQETSDKCIEDFPHLKKLIKNVATSSSLLKANEEHKIIKQRQEEFALKEQDKKTPFFKRIFAKNHAKQ